MRADELTDIRSWTDALLAKPRAKFEAIGALLRGAAPSCDPKAATRPRCEEFNAALNDLEMRVRRAVNRQASDETKAATLRWRQLRADHGRCAGFFRRAQPRRRTTMRRVVRVASSRGSPRSSGDDPEPQPDHLAARFAAEAA